MYPVQPSAYDRAITVFSPDGRLFQVEYAREGVRRGATAIGLTGKDGVVLIAHKPKTSKLTVLESLKKVFEVDDHMAIVATGLVADARRLIDMARVEAQKYRYTYNEPADIEYIAKHIADLMQLYTQYGGARPFGVSLIFGGVDTAPKVFEADPSGTLIGSNATVVGAGKAEVSEYLEKHYSDSLSMDQLIALGFSAMKQVPDMKIKQEIFEVAIVRTKTKTYEQLPTTKIEEFKTKA